MTNQELKTQTKQIREKYKKKREQIVNQRESILDKIKDIAEDYGKSLSKDESESNRNQKRVRLAARNRLMKTMKDEADEIDILMKRYRSTSKKITGTILSLTFISGLIRGHYLYNKDLKEKCKNRKTKKERELCILNLKKAMYEKKLKVLNDLIHGCDKAKDKKRCELRIQGYMFKVQDKIDKIKRKYVLANTGIWGE